MQFIILSPHKRECFSCEEKNKILSIDRFGQLPTFYSKLREKLKKYVFYIVDEKKWAFGHGP